MHAGSETCGGNRGLQLFSPVLFIRPGEDEMELRIERGRFEERVDQQVAALLTVDSPEKKKVAAALKLGESG